MRWIVTTGFNKEAIVNMAITWVGTNPTLYHSGLFAATPQVNEVSLAPARATQSLVGNVVSFNTVTSIIRSAALPGFFWAGAALLPPVSSRKVQDLCL
jgi:hypothetical protein